MLPTTDSLPAAPEAHPTGRLLVIDDDVELCGLVAEFLRREGLATELVHDGHAGLRAALEGEHDAIVLDVMLPGLGGFELLRRLRERRRTPVLMLTARGDHVDRVVGLEMGADDYIPKPFDPRELVARIRAVLRRAEVHAPSERLVNGELRVELAAREARYRGAILPLTRLELDLLVTLMRSAGTLVSREHLSRTVLGRTFQSSDRTLDVHLCNLRRKLGEQGAPAGIIRTVRGVGYLIPRAEGAPGRA